MQIARELIDPDADKVVRRLAQHGHQAYLVGGCVRDLLLGRAPKDFDVATSATPSEIRSLFRNCRIIGRRFRLAHIFFGSKIIETSTFRANPRSDEPSSSDAELLIRRDNVFGTDTEDAQRRDFTINGLFYDVEAEAVIDHVDGLRDLQKRLIRTIGDPDIRFREDPVRILRAIKFAARLGFEVEDTTFQAIVRHRSEITKCAQPRVLEELYRLLRGGAARRSMELLSETGVGACLSVHLAALFGGRSNAALEVLTSEGELESGLREEERWVQTWTCEPPELSADEKFLPIDDVSFASPQEITARREIAWNMLGQLDRHVAEGRETTNALALVACLGAYVLPDLLGEEIRPAEANAMLHELMQPIVAELRIARRDAERARQILLAQRRLSPSRRRRGKPGALVRRDYFGEALTLYELLCAARGETPEDLHYWKKMQAEGTKGSDRGDNKRRRRRGGRRRRRPGGELKPAMN